MESKPTLAMVGHVDAVFGGKRVRFELARDVPSVLALEKELGSLIAVGLRLERNDGWTLAEVRTILARAYRVPANAPTARNPRPVATITERPLIPTSPAPFQGINPSMLDPVLSVAPIGTYRALALLVLEALMLGLSPDRAVWDEREATVPTEAAA